MERHSELWIDVAIRREKSMIINPDGSCDWVTCWTSGLVVQEITCQLGQWMERHSELWMEPIQSSERRSIHYGDEEGNINGNSDGSCDGSGSELGGRRFG
jgi:hypothetical protein